MYKMEPRSTIFIGNPGVGKSTLSNALAGRVLFKNGVSFGGGLTQTLQMEEIMPGRWIGDTPGLADDQLRQQAALEIEKALKRGGSYQIIFVINLNAGRVLSADSTTIKLVLEALPSDIPYGIIINKVPKTTHEALQNPENIKNVFASLFCKCRPTRFVITIPEDTEITDQNDRVPKKEVLPRMFSLVNEILPFYRIAPSSVGQIDTRDYEAELKTAESEITTILNDNKVREEIFRNKIKEMEENMEQTRIRIEKERQQNLQQIQQIQEENQRHVERNQQQQQENKHIQETLQRENERLSSQIQMLSSQHEDQQSIWPNILSTVIPIIMQLL